MGRVKFEDRHRRLLLKTRRDRRPEEAPFDRDTHESLMQVIYYLRHFRIHRQTHYYYLRALLRDYRRYWDSLEEAGNQHFIFSNQVIIFSSTSTEEPSYSDNYSHHQKSKGSTRRIIQQDKNQASIEKMSFILYQDLLSDRNFSSDLNYNDYMELN